MHKDSLIGVARASALISSKAGRAVRIKKAVVVARIGRKLLKLGGALVLLPISLYSFNNQGISVSFHATDNLYLIDTKEGGNITSLSPFFQHIGFFGFYYDGNLSLINFDATNIFLVNYVELSKEIFLPGIGNKNVIYSNFYNHYSTSIEVYRITEASLGDSLNVYIGNFLFSPEATARYKYFFSDSVANYTESNLKLGIRIPIPYVFLNPEILLGIRIFSNKELYFYKIASHFYFPLTLDYSMIISLNSYNVVSPEEKNITSASYVDDPFFEEENISQMLALHLSLNRIFGKQRTHINIDVGWSHKEFFIIENQGRKDKRLRVNLQFTKFLNRDLMLSFSGFSQLNSSTIDDFDYMRNGIELSFRLIF